jgi:serine O-acetyltransferase
MTWRTLSIYRAIAEDLHMVLERDPSIHTRGDALLHPGLLAVWAYRVTHSMHQRGMRRGARLLSTVAKVATGGVEIHPGATIGRRLFIDPGARLPLT